MRLVFAFAVGALFGMNVCRFRDTFVPSIGTSPLMSPPGTSPTYRHVRDQVRWISREETTRDFMRDPTELVMAVPVPNVEKVTTSRREHAMNFAIRFVFIREEHHPELAHDSVEATVSER